MQSGFQFVCCCVYKPLVSSTHSQSFCFNLVDTHERPDANLNIEHKIHPFFPTVVFVRPVIFTKIVKNLDSLLKINNESTSDQSR